jgi:hypothetical protein
MFLSTTEPDSNATDAPTGVGKYGRPHVGTYGGAESNVDCRIRTHLVILFLDRCGCLGSLVEELY